MEPCPPVKTDIHINRVTRNYSARLRIFIKKSRCRIPCISKTYPLLCYLLLVPLTSNATTLVALRNSTSVVLAVDGKGIPTNNRSQPFTTRKIIPCGEYFVAVAGIHDMSPAGSERFDVDAIIKTTCKTGQKPLEAMNAVMALMEPQYKRLIARLDIVEHAYLRRVAAAKDKEIAQNIIMIGSYQKVPFILSRDLIPFLENDLVVVKRTVERNLIDKLMIGQTQYTYAGVYAELKAFADISPKDIPRATLAEAANFLVAYQISRTPQRAGYPIDVVTVTAEGKVTWVSCNPNCKQEDQ
jgi:hypothetical protein